MSKPTAEQVLAAKDHLVTLVVRTLIASDDIVDLTLTGVLDSVDLDGHIGITTGFTQGTYDYWVRGDEVGSENGMTMPLVDIVAFTDHGERSDFLTNLRHLMGARDQALQALKDAEANIARAYAEVTNLAAQEG